MAKITQLIIGDELLSGKIQDLNIKWLATFLLNTGHELTYSKIIHDEQEQIKASITEALISTDIVILSGGLGPTLDDKTKNILSSFLDAPLVHNEEAMNQVKTAYELRGKSWSRDTNSYNLIPEGVTPLFNPSGLAPGLYSNNDGKLIFCTPGVPCEFQNMVSEVIFPLISEVFGTGEKEQELYNIRTKGIPEEKIFSELCPNLWQELEKYGKVSSLPQHWGVDITLTLDKDEKLASNKEEIRSLIKASNISENVWQFGMLELPEYIVALAYKKSLTFAFAESCTGGLSASKITDVSGSSRSFLGSVVSYANELKTGVLKVNIQTIKDHGAVSSEVAFEMADGMRKLSDSDLCISFTGIAGPTGGTKEKPVGTVGIGWSTREKTESMLFNFRGDRLSLKEKFSHVGLFKLLELIHSH